MFYRVVRLNVPDGMGGRVYKYYARAFAIAHATIDMIAARIAETNTLTPTDVKACFDGVWREIFGRLREGQIVELGELGHFRLIVRNNGGSLTEEEWKPDLIKGVYVQFIPTKSMKSIAKGAPAERWRNPEMKAAQRAVSVAARAHADAQKSLQDSETMLARFQFRQQQQRRSVIDSETQIILDSLRAEVERDRLNVEKTDIMHQEKRELLREIKEKTLLLHGIDLKGATVTLEDDNAEFAEADIEAMGIKGAKLADVDAMADEDFVSSANAIDLQSDEMPDAASALAASAVKEMSPLLSTEQLADNLDDAEAQLLFKKLQQRLADKKEQQEAK